MARCPACLQGEMGPSGSCESCGLASVVGRAADGESAAAETRAETRSDEPRKAADPAAVPFHRGLLLGGRYQVVRLLGRGGMGEVWQALDLKLRVDVALKRLRPEWVGDERMLERLRGEARAARDVVSPNVCRIFDLVELDGEELVSMEFVDGTTLSQAIRERGPLEPREALEIASQFLAGLEAIHQAGLMHRDVKPDNVMITRAGRVVVMDFGLARPQAGEETLTLAGTPAYMAPEQLRGTGIDARADLYAAGLVLAEMVGSTGAPEVREAILRGAREDPPRLPDSPWRPVLLRAVAERREARWASARELMRALEQVALRVDGAEALRPYPGLASFTEADAEYFFGRELEVEALWHKLGQAHLLAVIGPSGAGKSSFLRAGLLPARPAGWRAVVCTPGTRPFAGLAHALADEFARDQEAVHELLRIEEPDVALSLLGRWRARHGEALLIIDQFEELFTLNDDAVQARFAELLGRAAVEADVHVLVSLRDDFLIHCQAHAGLAPVFADLTPLNPPTGTALRRAVVQPALQCGYRFEDEDLAAEMIDAVARERGALPLLAFAAARLWEERDRAAGLLTRAAYARIGGVGGALAQHAEATVERIGTEHLPRVRELFRNLVTAQGTRAVRDYEELLSVFGEQRAEAETVLRGLIDARLLVEYEERTGRNDADRPRRRVEIIHESLLAAWPRLVRWQAQDAEGAVLRDQLRQAAATWEEHGRASDLLWTGTAYQEFSVWQERYPGGLTATEQAFAEAMTAERQRRRRRRRIAVTSLVSVLLGGLLVVSALWWESVKAKRAREAEALHAQASQLLALGRNELARDPAMALAYARKSLELADTPAARRFAVEVLWRGPIARIVSPSAVPGLQPEETAAWLGQPVFSPDAAWLAFRNNTTGRALLFPRDGETPRFLPRPPDGNASAFAFGPQGDLLVTPGGGSSLRLHSLPDLHEIRSIELGGSRSRGWVSDGKLVTMTKPSASDPTRSVRAWPLPDGEPRTIARFDSSDLVDWKIDRNARWLIDVRDRTILQRPIGPSGAGPERVVGRLPSDLLARGSYVLFYDRSGLFTAEGSGDTRFWSLEEGATNPVRVVRSPWGQQDWYPTDREASLLVRWTRGMTLSLVDLRDPPDTLPAELPVGVGEGVSTEFDPGGRWLALVNGQTLRLYPVRVPRRRVIPIVGGGTWGLQFSPDSRWLASCTMDQPARLWPMHDRDGSSRDLQPPCGCWGFAFDPSGTNVLVGTANDRQQGRPDGRVLLYPVAGGPPRLFSTGWEGESGVWLVAFDRPGRRAVAIRGRGTPTLRVWDVASGAGRTYLLEQLTELQASSIFEGVFAPDGSLLVSSGDVVHRLVIPEDPGGKVTAAKLFTAKGRTRIALGPDGRTLLVLAAEDPNLRIVEYEKLVILDLETGASREVTSHGRRLSMAIFDPTGTLIVSGDHEGVVRVGPVSGAEPHLLLGAGPWVENLAVSPDGRWVAAAAGEEISLWPMPDLAKRPLHTQPLPQLLATLDSFTNQRVVADPSSATGWKLDLAPFPGWKDLPSW